MVSIECHEGLRKLADTFGSSLSTDKVAQYYEIFQPIDAADWIRSCDRARLTCDKFPTPKMLNEILIEARSWKRSSSPFTMRVFECKKCLNSFCFDPSKDGDVIACPGQWYSTDDHQVCNMLYDKKYLIQHSVEAR